MRCRVTRAAVYEQHRRLGRELLDGYPEVFEVLIRPGAQRVTYTKTKLVDPWGEWDGLSFVYKPDRQGWRPLMHTLDPKTGGMTKTIHRVALALAAGATAFDVLGDGFDPYALR